MRSPWPHRAAPPSTAVGDCATTEPIVAHPDWPVDRAMEAMARAQIGRLPVVANGYTLAGIVTLGSLALRSKKDKETLKAAKEVSRRSVKAPPRASSSAPRRPPVQALAITVRSRVNGRPQALPW